MRKNLSVRRKGAVLFLLFLSGLLWSQIDESFETGLPAGYNSTLSSVTLSSGEWQVKDVITGTSGVQTGSKSAQLRSATGSQLITPLLSGGVGEISFYVTSSTASGAYQVNISEDNGATWKAAPGSPFTVSTLKVQRTVTINSSAVNKVQIYRTGATLYVDDIKITTYPSTPAGYPPVLTPAVLNVIAGTSFSYQVQATNSPTSYGLVLGSLPDGLSLNTATGLITGTPTVVGNYDFTLTATNAGGTSEPAAYNLTVAKGTQQAVLPDVAAKAGSAPRGLPVSTDAGQPLSYSSDNPSVAAVSGTLLSPGNAGTATVTASAPANENYEAFNDTFMVTVTEGGLVISQVYGAGGNSGAVFNRDYVELYNPTNTPVSLKGYTLQYAAATSLTWANNATNYLPDVTIPPGHYYLIQTTTSGTNGTPLPAPDFSYVTSMDMAGSNGKVALVHSTAALSGANPVSESILDMVGFGTANGYETTAAPAPSATTAIFRKNNGAQDTDNNSTDFETGTPAPRNSAYGTSTTWNGNAWSAGEPTATMDAVIHGSYTSTGNLTAKSLTVNAAGTFTLNAGHVLTTGDITNEGIVEIRNGAQVLQTDVAVNTGGATVYVDSAPVRRLDFAGWSSPVSGSQTLKQFSPFTLDNRFYTYANGQYAINTGGTAQFEPARGYLIRTPNTFTTTAQPYNGMFTGTLNTGTLTPAVTAGFNFLGNPYPSTLDLNVFLDVNSNLDPNIYLWTNLATLNADGSYSGTNYTVYNRNSGSVPAGMSEFVSSGQAFFVQAAAPGTVTFSNQMRRSTAASMRKPAGTSDRFWLELSSATGTKSQFLAAFVGGAGSGYDPAFDAALLDSNPGVLYAAKEGRRLVINAEAPFTGSEEIALTVDAAAAQTHTLRLIKGEGVFDTAPVYLKDLTTGITVDLSKGSYTFMAEKGQSGRFVLTFTTGHTLGTEEGQPGAGTVIALDGDTLRIRSTEILSQVEVYDLSGKLLKKRNVQGKEATVPLASLHGILLVRVSTATATVTRKILKNP